MNIIVIGCGRVGAELASRLFFRNNKVTVVDQNAAAFDNLHPDFRGHLVEGEALNQDVLIRAGVEGADGLAAVTNSDSLNAVVAHIAQSVYNILNVVARNYDPSWRPYYDSFDLQIVGSSSWGAQRIEELLYHKELRSVFSAGNGEIEIYEFTIPASWNGKRFVDLTINLQCHLVSITRVGVATLPDEDGIFKTGDIVLVSATMNGIQDLQKRLASNKEI